MFATALLLLQATFHSPRLVESSGVAVSRAYPGVLWTHNDSGDGPYLYATDLRGTDRSALLLPGAQAIDWEDMSLGPCPVAFPLQPRPPRSNAPTCIYLADTGDNMEFRPFVTIYAIPEPAPPARASDTAGTTRAPAVLRLRYPDGVHDVEAPRSTFSIPALAAGWCRRASVPATLPASRSAVRRSTFSMTRRSS